MYQIKVNRECLKLNGPVCDRKEHAALKDRFERTGYSDIYENVLNMAGLRDKQFSDEEKAFETMNNLDEYFKIEWERLMSTYPKDFFRDCDFDNGASFYVTKI